MAGYVKVAEMYKIKNVIEINDIIYLSRLCDEWTDKYKTKNVLVVKKMQRLLSIPQRMQKIGIYIVSEGLFRWKVKMVSFTFNSHGGPPFIGIIEDKEDFLEELFEDGEQSWWDDHGYEFCARTGSLFGDTDCHVTSMYQCRWMNDGDVLEMTLNLDERTLGFTVNNKDFGVAFSNIKQAKYRLAFSTFKSKESQFMLLDC